MNQTIPSKCTDTGNLPGAVHIISRNFTANGAILSIGKFNYTDDSEINIIVPEGSNIILSSESSGTNYKLDWICIRQWAQWNQVPDGSCKYKRLPIATRRDMVNAKYSNAIPQSLYIKNKTPCRK